MSDLSNVMRNEVANLFRGTNSTGFTPYMALFSVMPAADGTGGTEVTTTIRTAGRPAVTLAAPNAGATSNSAVVDFGNAAGAATVVGYGFYDAASGGNLRSRKAFGSSQAVAQGAPVSFAVGAATLTIQ